MDKPVPQILAILPAFIPSTILCVVKPFLRLHYSKRIRFRLNLERKINFSDIERSDLVVFCRNTDPQHAFILDYLFKNGKRYIYDLDDNFFEISESSEIGRYHRHPGRLTMLTHYLKSANLVRVYSAPLLERIKELNSNVERVSGPLNMENIQKPAKRRNAEKIKIVFATSRLDDELASIFLPALQRILNTLEDIVEVHFWGTRPKLTKMSKSIIFHPRIFDYDKFMKRFSKTGHDIGLAPLKSDIFHRSKTNNKFREYSACRIAGIYSDVDVYAQCVVNGETGLLVENREEAWHEAMNQLIQNENLRERIKNQAKEQILKQYGQGKFEEVWLRQIQRILKDHSPKDQCRYLSVGIESLINPGGTKGETRFSRKRFKHFVNRLYRNEWHYSLQLLKQHIYDYWMTFKIHRLIR